MAGLRMSVSCLSWTLEAGLGVWMKRDNETSTIDVVAAEYRVIASRGESGRGGGVGEVQRRPDHFVIRAHHSDHSSGGGVSCGVGGHIALVIGEVIAPVDISSVGHLSIAESPWSLTSATAQRPRLSRCRCVSRSQRLSFAGTAVQSIKPPLPGH